MQPLLRLAALVFIVGLLVVGIFVVPYTCSPSNWLTESLHSEEFQHWQQAIERYRQGQFQAVQAWRDQRCSLAETLQRFEELDREYAQHWPPFPDRMRQLLPLHDDEWHYRLIRERLQSILYGQPEELPLALRRLEKDFQRLPAGRPKSAERRDEHLR